NGGGPDARRDDVHIFEMHWADLSRVGKGMLSIAGGLYQLVLHIAYLGRKSLDLAAAASKLRPKSPEEPARWRQLATAHAWIVRLFTIAVPTSTLLLLACVALFVPDGVTPSDRLWVGTVIVCLVAIVTFGALTYFAGRAKNGATHFLFWMSLAVAVGVVINLLARTLGGDRLGTTVLGATAVLLVVVTYLVVINRYDSSAPGALSWGLAGLFVTIVGTAVWAPRFVRTVTDGSPETLRYAALAAFQWSYVILLLAWTAIWIAAFVAAVFGFRLRRALRHLDVAARETRARALRALWTARVTLAASFFGLIITGLVGYEAMTVVAWRVHETFDVFPTIAERQAFPLIARPLVPPKFGCPQRLAPTKYDGAACGRRFFEGLIGQSATVGLPVALGTAALSIFLISWFIALVAVTSAHRPRSPSRYAENLGQWVTDGFRWIRRAGSVLVVGLLLAISFGIVAWVWMAITGRIPQLARGFGPDRAQQILKWMAVSLLASAATLAAVRGRLELVASRARPALGIILDVDNYLRESPRSHTPRAQIAERFASLLRHVVERRDENGARYFDRIVIVSHSQGTVIAADLLRYLTIAQVESPDLSTVDIRLMTMGSPLRQLYAANFPHLYNWIDRTDSFGDATPKNEDAALEHRRISGHATLAIPAEGGEAAMELSGLSPSPRWLRVREWVNLYTSGDYIGRTLWQTSDERGVWAYQSPSEAKLGSGRRERCLGDGTHTRYWTSADVAAELDALIRRAPNPLDVMSNVLFKNQSSPV
ncbi:MAG TPA: hypothetical protein VHV78_09305, partial [Gemmatimonadaceae bacterium]|nr:hypothetical protein [Gemmatimonadaceae bacterium]